MAHSVYDSALALTNWTRILRIPRRPRESVNLPSPYAPLDIIEVINPHELAAAVLHEIERQYEPKRQSGWEDSLDVGIFNPLQRLFVLNISTPPSTAPCRSAFWCHWCHRSRTFSNNISNNIGRCYAKESRRSQSTSPPLYGDLVRSVFGRAVVVGVSSIGGLLDVEILLDHHN